MDHFCIFSSLLTDFYSQECKYDPQLTIYWFKLRVAVFPEGSINKRCPRPQCHATTHHFTPVSLLTMSIMPLAVFLKVQLQKQIFLFFSPKKTYQMEKRGMENIFKSEKKKKKKEIMRISSAFIAQLHKWMLTPKWMLIHAVKLQ